MLGSVRVTVPESRRMVALYVAAGASFAALSARGLTVPLYAHDLGASRFEVGALFSVSTLAGALLSLPAGVLVDRFGTRALLGLSFVLAAASQLATAATPSVFPLFIWQVVGTSVSSGLTSPMLRQPQPVFSSSKPLSFSIGPIDAT